MWGLLAAAGIVLGGASLIASFLNYVTTSDSNPTTSSTNQAVYAGFNLNDNSGAFHGLSWQDVGSVGTEYRIQLSPDINSGYQNGFSSSSVLTNDGQFEVGGFTPKIINNYFNITAEPAVVMAGHAVTTSGQAAANATVYISDSTAQKTYAVKTNQYGFFRFFANPNDSYQVWGTYAASPNEDASPAYAVASDLNGQYSQSPEYVNGSNNNGQALKIPGTVVQGYIKDHNWNANNGNVIANATVTISANGGMQTQTDVYGHYMFGVPSNGTYTLSIQASGYNEVSKSIQVNTMEPDWQNFTSMDGLVNPLPQGIVSYYQILLTNTQGVATPAPFQQMIVVDSASFFNLEALNLSNVRFFYANGSVIPSWLASGNLAGDNHTVYWLRLNNSIEAYSSETIYIGFANTSTNFFNSAGPEGEASALSEYGVANGHLYYLGNGSYGKYDDGQAVFDLYANFWQNRTFPAWDPSTVVGSFVPGQIGGAGSYPKPGYLMMNGVIDQATQLAYGYGFQTQNIVFEMSMGYSGGGADDMGLGIYSTGPNDGSGGLQPWAVNGYYASYEFYSGSKPAILYSGTVEARASSQNMLQGIWDYSLFQVTVAPGGIAMNLIQNANNPYAVPVESGLTNEVSWNSSISNSYSGLYIGAGTGSDVSYQYLYWILARAEPPNGVMPSVAGPFPVEGYLHLAAINYQGAATSNPFQLKLTIDAKNYQSMEDSGLTNVGFMLGSGQVLSSWLESGNSNSNNAIFWLKFPQISAQSYVDFYLVFFNSANLMNGMTIGEAPNLSSQYGGLDNGWNVFLWYTNFAGSSRPPGFSQWTYSSVSNGLTITPPGQYITGVGVSTNATYSQYTTTDISGYPLYVNGNEYSAMQFGYSAARSLQLGNPSGDSYVSFPWGGANANYPYVQAVWSIMRYGPDAWSMYNYGTIHENINVNTSNGALVDNGQGNAYKSVVHWWRVRYSPPEGVMPTISGFSNVSFKATGLSGQEWGVAFYDPILTQTPTDHYTTGNVLNILGAGNVSYVIFAPSGYGVSPSSGDLSLGVNSATVNLAFSSNSGHYATFDESGLPSGVQWEVQMGNQTDYANAPSSITVSGANSGSYTIPDTTWTDSQNGNTYVYAASPSSGTATNGQTIDVTFTVSYYCTSGGVCDSVFGSTPILLANWTYEQADQIIPGTQLLVYDASTGNYTSMAVNGIYSDTHSTMVIINGLLNISLNQTVLTDKGYVSAENLTIGSYVFVPFANSYIKVSSINIEYGSFLMYDFVFNSGTQGYIAWWYVLSSDS